MDSEPRELERRPRRKSWVRRGAHLALRAALIWGAIVSLFAVFQRSLIYVPTREPNLAASRSGLAPGLAFDVQVESDGVTLHGWHCVPRKSKSANVAEANSKLLDADWVVLFFSGNAGHRAYRVDEIELLQQQGCHVFLFDYRGYGDNEGKPSEAAFAADAQRIWNHVTNDLKVPREKVILVGESLGGGVAVRLASDLCARGEAPGGLLLRSTFSSLADVGQFHFPWLPVRLALLDRYPSEERIRTVTCPILHIHGTSDTVVPERFGRKLFAAAPARSTSGVEKRFVALKNVDHNDVLVVAADQVMRAVGDWLGELRKR